MLRLRSLTTRVILITITLLSCGIGAFAYLNLHREQEQLVKGARESAELLLHTIERSIFNSMRIGNTGDVQTILQMVGRSHNLANVHIFHPQGIVLKSAIPEEVGHPVTDAEYALFINNRQQGVIDLPGQGPVLSVLKPIYNEEPCHVCHGHRPRVIGVLGVNYSLRDTQQRLLETSRLLASSTLVIVVILSAAISLVMLRFVRRPLERIVENMARVEEGDLSVRMEARGDDEIGQLIARFDSMVERLDSAKQELEDLHFQQLERADRLASVGEMAAGIAHEIRNPLTGISSAMTIIKDDFTVDDPRRQIVEEVLEQIKRLDKTVNDLLFFGRPADPEPMYSDINAILRKTLLFSLQHRGGRSIDRQVSLAEDLPLVFVDPKQMQQVFLNLILNAVQAMSAGGVLRVSSELISSAAPPRVRVTIADTGPGIPPQVRDKIFTPFFTTKAQGTGLGLAICHKLVTQHGGTINVTSDADTGTAFIVELPAQPTFCPIPSAPSITPEELA